METKTRPIVLPDSLSSEEFVWLTDLLLRRGVAAVLVTVGAFAGEREGRWAEIIKRANEKIDSVSSDVARLVRMLEERGKS